MGACLDAGIAAPDMYIVSVEIPCSWDSTAAQNEHPGALDALAADVAHYSQGTTFSSQVDLMQGWAMCRPRMCLTSCALLLPPRQKYSGSLRQSSATALSGPPSDVLHWEEARTTHVHWTW